MNHKDEKKKKASKEKNVMLNSDLLLNENSREADLMGRAVLSNCFSFDEEHHRKLRMQQGQLLKGLYKVIKEELGNYPQEQFEFDICAPDIQKLFSGKSIINLSYVHEINKLIKSKNLDESSDFQEKLKKQFNMSYQEIIRELTRSPEKGCLAKCFMDIWQYETCDFIKDGITDYYISYKVNKNFNVYCTVCNGIAATVHLYRSLDDKAMKSFQEYMANLTKAADLHEILRSENGVDKLKFNLICNDDNQKERQEFEKNCMENKDFKKNTAEKLIQKIMGMPLKYTVSFFTLFGHLTYMNLEDWKMMGNIVLCEDKKDEILQTLNSYSQSDTENNIANPE